MSATPPTETIQSILERAKILYSVKDISTKLSVDAKTISRWVKNEASPSPLMIPGIKEALFGKPPAAQKPADFTFIDLFAGIGGIRLGFESAGGRCVFTSEWNKHSQKTYMTNFMDEHPIAGDITKLDADSIPDHDVLVGGFPCFAKGTLVHAFDGLRPIETIREGDMVLGQSGEFRRATAAMVKHDAPTRQLRIMGCPELTTTDEHPFLARRSVLVWNSLREAHEREMSPATWVDAKDLHADHFVGLPIDREMDHSTSTLSDEQKSTSFWFAAGQWLGHEIHAVDERRFISEFEADPAMRELPGYCFHLPKALQSALWHGWISAQGAQNLPDAQEGTTSSEKLALGMARIARNVFSTTPAIRNQKALGENFTWRLILSTRASPNFFCDGSFIWAKVRKNQTTGKTETVHNIAVDVDESYVVEGALVHNCQPFSIAGVSKKASMGRKHGFEDKTQGTLFFDVARIIKAKRPKAFMLENVKNLLSHDKGNTFKIIKETLEKDLGYTISHRVIDGQHFTPQHRERILIVGFREDVGFDFSKLALPAQGPKLASILHPQNGTEKIADDCISGAKGIIGAKYTITDNLWAYLQAYAAKHKAAGNGFGFGMVGPQSVTRTLSARYYKDGSEILVDQGKKKNPRRLTPRECARLQGFPDHYKIPVSDSQAYKQFGNSVVVPVMAAVAAHMKPHLMGLIAAQAALAAPAAAATAKPKKKK